MKYLVLIFAALYLSICSAQEFEWYDIGEAQVVDAAQFALMEISKREKKEYYLLDIIEPEGESYPGSKTIYNLRLLAAKDNTPYVCTVSVVLDNMKGMEQLLPNWRCDKQYKEEIAREDFPLEEEPEDDPSGPSQRCSEEEEEKVMAEIMKEMNAQVDAANEELDYPGMIDMTDLKQSHYDDGSMESCTKTTSGEITTYRVRMKATQAGMAENCEIVLTESEGTIKLPKSQCQGQN